MNSQSLSDMETCQGSFVFMVQGKGNEGSEDGEVSEYCGRFP